MKKIHINNDDNYATPPEFYNKLNKGQTKFKRKYIKI
jgi:hypothetical protein